MSEVPRHTEADLGTPIATVNVHLPVGITPGIFNPQEHDPLSTIDIHDGLITPLQFATIPAALVAAASHIFVQMERTGGLKPGSTWRDALTECVSAAFQMMGDDE